jgi:hypothetical protein
MPLQELTLPELERALRIVSRGLQPEDNPPPLLVPPPLRHLTKEDWEHLESLLHLLMMQKSRARIQ